MNTLDLILGASGSAEDPNRPRHSNRLPLDCEPLEPRQLLSGVQATTNSETSVPQVIGDVAGAGASTGTLGQTSAGATVVTQAVGDVDNLQSQLPVSDLLSNLSQVTDAVYETPGPISVASGLTSLPISPLLQAVVTENETPLNNGTPIEGTVWITPPPVPPGMFHIGTTVSPVVSHYYMQSVNPQGGPPSFTHFGQSPSGSLNGVTVEEPVATGPIGPSITDEIEPAQPPPVGAHQQAGPPSQVQQDETTPQQGATTPPGGEQGAGHPGTPGQGSVPGQQGGAGSQGQGNAAGQQGQGGQTANPGEAGGQGAQGPGQGGSGGSGGASSGGAAFLSPPHLEVPGVDIDSTLDLIDAALPSLAIHTDQDAANADDDGRLSTLFGAAAIAAGGLRLALRDSNRVRRPMVAGPPNGAPVRPTRTA